MVVCVGVEWSVWSACGGVCGCGVECVECGGGCGGVCGCGVECVVVCVGVEWSVWSACGGVCGCGVECVECAWWGVVEEHSCSA